MEGDVSGVRITPPILEFYDTKPDNVFQLTVNVKNISKISRNIRYYGPKSQKFNIKVKNPDQPVAPGLSVQAVIEYQPTDKNEVKDRLVVTVDGDVIEVPIRAFPSQPVLELEKSVNFGHIVATSRVIGREIALINHGSLSGQFKLEYNGKKHLSAHPASGSVPPHSVQIIKIECVTKEPGKLDESFSVTLEGQEESILQVTGNIVKRSLQLLSIHDEQTIECVKFGSTYYGTDKTEYAILHNNGPETINFVAIMDEEAEAQELGVDLSQTTAAALAEESSSGLSKGSTNILTSLITAIPNQGVLRPYEKIPIFFRFSPRWYSSKQGWKCQVTPPPRKDFALFMRLQIIGSNSGISNQKDDVANSNKDGCFAEVALTGTALPVLLDISPAPVFDFGECLVGEHADVLFTLKNDSTILPATFQFKRIAHFSTHPPNGKISPGQTQDVIFSFSPRQVGTFTPQQLLDVLGHVADNRNPTLTHLKVIHTMGIQFKGTSDPVVIKPSPRFNPGITPMISNEVGLYVDETTFVKLETNKPRNALIGANKTRLHALKSATTSRDDEDNDDDSQVRIAYPNDRAQSIRPTDKRERYKTIFTKAERHHYIDPDYAYTDEEEEQIRQHTDKYRDFIRNLRENRLNKQKHSEFTKTNNSVDIGLKSAGGLRPFTIKTDHIKPDPQIPAPPNANWKLLSAKELSEIEKIAMTRNVSEGLNAVPTTLQEKKDCSKWLTPQQLHQLVIGPSTIDFSKVCLRSVSQKDIIIINNLEQFVHIVAEIDCKELRQSSPLSQVIPPMSKAVIPVIFESSIQGTFQRSVLYTVNGFHQDHVTVLAEVVPVSIELSTNHLVLKPTIGSPADAGIRGVITLYNRYNHNADFRWSPKIGEKGTAFSIRPASGSVKAFKSLDCEVVWHPSYLAPLDGEFSLDVIGGTSVELQCYAELGHSNVRFVDRRITFGQVPVNLTTVRTALLHNTGPNHAYFQVLDPNPFPGLTVSPVHGVIPVGGTTEIKVALTPDAVLKFDTRIQISIKGGKCIELRMGGTVESPAVDIDLPSFHLGGVYCGSGTQVPFKLINKTVTKAKVEFDLTRYKDFTLNFPGSQSQDDYNYQMMNPGLYSVGLRPEEVITGELTFMPREVAAYDFIMPVVVNHIGAPSPAPTPFPPTPAPSQKNSLDHIINPRPKPATVVTPRKHVVATALRQPLQLSTNRIEFNLPSSFNEVTMNTGFGGSKSFVLVNNSDKVLKWALDLSQPSKALEEGILKFLHPTGLPFMKNGSGCGIEGELDPGKTQSIVILFCPNAPGQYDAVVPIIVNEEWTKPYQYLQVMGELKAPKIWFDPPSLCLTPVPLLTEISGEFNLLASQYKKVTPLDVELPQVECEDGSKISPLKISFSQGHDVQPCCGDSGQMDPCSLRCKVTFISTKPISFSQPIIFKDTEGQSFKIFITATADNCILSCYPFLALHRTDHQIVCEQAVAGDVASGEIDEAVADAQAVVEECEAELAYFEESLVEAIPAVEAAMSGLNAINYSDIVLIRSFANPPAPVKLVLESICVILDIKPERRPVPNQPKKMVKDYWIPSKKLLADRFLDRMKNFDKDNIPSGVMKRVREKYLSNPEFEPNCIRKVSAACEGLCRWVQAINVYDKVAKIIGPKKAKLAEAESALATQMEKINAYRSHAHVGSVPKGRRIQGSITSDSVGEAVIVPCHTPPRSHSRQSTSATSSNFQISTSSYESSIDCTDGTEGTTPLNRDGAMNKQQMSVEPNGRPIQEIPSRSVGSAMFPDEDTEEGLYHTEVLMAVQRWFTANGWPGGPFPIQIPYTLRISLSKKKDDEKGGGSWDTTSVKKDVKTIYDMISHLSGRPVPGIPVNASLPANPVERVKQIYWQHSTLLTFIRCQGGSVSGIRPEHLMELGDCILWKELQAEIKRNLLQQGKTTEAGNIIDSEPIVDEEIFEALSKRAWTDLLLQIMKCLVLAKITPRTLKNIATPTAGVTMPIVNPDPLCSNIYCVGERIILTWLNHHYEKYRRQIWKNSTKGGVPPSRWIVNYDMDLLDGLVVGSVLGAHLPFLVDDYLSDMYTHPTTAEQCLHNALKVVNAMRFAGIEYDIQAIDITDPNPVSMLFLCMHLYQKLPQYLPKDDIDFTGSLHSTVTRQVKLTNSSSKSLNYHVLLAGPDAKDFHVPKGDHVTVPPKTTYPLTVEHVSRFLRPAEAVLVLVGRRQGSTTGTTMTFHLHTQIDNITPLMTLKTESPCYELERITLDVTNPFNEGGEFKIILMETNMDTSDPSKPAATSVLLRTKDKKKKKVKAKIDHGQNRPETPPTPPPPVITDTEQLGKTKKDDEAVTLSAFSSPMKTFYLGAGSSAEVQIDFLPFFTGDRQCSVIFLNENIGEFLYSIEAKATLPLPSPLPFLPNQNTIRISSAAPHSNGRSLQGGEETVMYWKCDSGQLLKQTLLIPVTNMTKEKALILAAQQRMSDLEIQRRSATGTLTSSSVAAKTVKLLSSSASTLGKTPKTRNDNFNKYTVEVDSEYYKLPSSLSMPSPLDARSHSAPTITRIPQGIKIEDGIVELPVTFKAKSPGHYPAEIILRAPDDIRVYHIETTVNPDGSMAELELSVPVNQSLTQNIPIVNLTNHDWPLRAEITGDGFSGPPSHLAKAYQTAQYPLVYKPLYETPVEGKLVLSNIEDGTDHVFILHGKPEKPLAVDHIQINCQAKQSVIYSVRVPNATKKKQSYFIESDLDFTSGKDSIMVLPGQTGTYDLVVSPDRRGTFKGVITFTASENPPVEVDSDGDEVPTNPNDVMYNGYRIWYSVEVIVAPPPPERSLDIICCCRKRTLIDVIVRNPTVEDINLQATIIGRDLEGPLSLTLPGGEKDVYTLTFAPSHVGKQTASLIFYSPAVGEFWYELLCNAEPPAKSVLQHMECELGRWTKQMIHLDNPTNESLELIPFVSNLNNFSLEVDNERPLSLRPNSTKDVPLHFMPSTLGSGSHTTKIAFTSKQFGEWVFEASGTGLLPSPQDPVSVYTPAGNNTNLIIPFRNPTDHMVRAEVILTAEDENLSHGTMGIKDDRKSSFSLLLKLNTALRVPPKATLDIPVNFAPCEMMKYQSLLTVIVKRDDGKNWEDIPNSQSGEPARTTAGGLPEIKWLFPIQGIPESRPVRDSQAPVIECRARETVEQRLEVTLAGVAPCSAGPHKRMKTRAITPKNHKPTLPDGIVVGETLATTNEFMYEISFGEFGDSKALKNSVNLSLVRQHRDNESGLVVLVFNVIFNPFKSLSCDVQLLVQAATGGLWKFPLRFRSTEPPADDVIQIEATGLKKPSSVGFRLNSQSMQPVPFKAFFLDGSDQEISVSPQKGELLPNDTEGTLFVVNFLPTVYGKVYMSKLIIQTPDMQWSYDVRGVLPEYSPPRGTSSKPMAGPHPDPRHRGKPLNYVQENLHLLTTAVSSPIKGSKLVLPRVM